MQTKLTIAIRDIDIEAGYQAMAADEEQEVEALAWAEATLGDVTLDDSNFEPAVWGETPGVAL